jgi:hypothetical protein
MARTVTIYGIKNCDTMKKARAWLDKRGVSCAFHNYKSAGIERDMLEGWAGKVGWDTLINRAGRAPVTTCYPSCPPLPTVMICPLLKRGGCRRRRR